jgi:hypothetical protein
VLCGACGIRLAAVRQGLGRVDMPSNGKRVVAFDVRGWRRDDDGTWRVPPEARHEFFAGRRMVLMRGADARFPRDLANRLECPACGAAQSLDPDVLDVSPNVKKGFFRTRVRVMASPAENPAWCAMHRCPSEGHGKHDAQPPC